jgi:Domain of unknown function (DU1801)
MAKNKTTETQASVAAFLKKISDAKRRKDFSAIIDLVTEHTGFEAKMWGTAIVGFGSYDYKYESGREGSAPLVGIASRSSAIALYLSAGFDNREELLAKFGKHTAAKGCVYIKSLEDIDKVILIKMVKNSIRYYKNKYPAK